MGLRGPRDWKDAAPELWHSYWIIQRTQVRQLLLWEPFISTGTIFHDFSGKLLFSERCVNYPEQWVLNFFSQWKLLHFQMNQIQTSFRQQKFDLSKQESAVFHCCELKVKHIFYFIIQISNIDVSENLQNNTEMIFADPFAHRPLRHLFLPAQT